jgi:hypothetical protein
LSYCYARCTLKHLQIFLQYIIVEFTPSIILLNLPSPHSYNSFNRIHFLFTCMCIGYWHHIHPLHHHLTSPPHWYQTPWLDLSCTPVFHCTKSKIIFCLFKKAIEAVSFWHFHVCVYYNVNWCIPSMFLLSILDSFICWFQKL